MWIYEKRLEYPVRITKPDPRMAKLLMAQYGGPDSDVCANKEIVGRRASCRTQIPTPPRKTGTFADVSGLTPHKEFPQRKARAKPLGFAPSACFD